MQISTKQAFTFLLMGLLLQGCFSNNPINAPVSIITLDKKINLSINSLLTNAEQSESLRGKKIAIKFDDGIFEHSWVSDTKITNMIISEKRNYGYKVVLRDEFDLSETIEESVIADDDDDFLSEANIVLLVTLRGNTLNLKLSNRKTKEYIYAVDVELEKQDAPINTNNFFIPSNIAVSAKQKMTHKDAETFCNKKNKKLPTLEDFQKRRKLKNLNDFWTATLNDSNEAYVYSPSKKHKYHYYLKGYKFYVACK